MAQKRKTTRKKSRKTKHPILVAFQDLGYAKQAIVKYNITKEALLKLLSKKIKEYEKDYRRMLLQNKEDKAKGRRPTWNTDYMKEKIETLKKFRNALKRKNFKSQKELWEWLELEGWRYGVEFPLIFLRNITFDRVNFPIVSKLVGREVVNLWEGSREFMTESDTNVIRYYDEEGRAFSIWTQWMPEKNNPLKGVIIFTWDSGYEG